MVIVLPAGLKYSLVASIHLILNLFLILLIAEYFLLNS